MQTLALERPTVQPVGLGATEIAAAQNSLVEQMEDCLGKHSSIERVDPFGAIELRRATDADAGDVVCLLNRAYRGTGTEAGWTTEAGLIDGDRDSEAMLRRDISEKPDAMLMVWEPNGQVQGCVWLEPGDDRQWYLGSFAVDPRLQNNGAGRRLLAACETCVREHGGQTVKMTVIESRQTLIAWYERRGYRRTGETIPFPYTEKRFGIPRHEGLRFAVLRKEIVKV